MPRAITSLLLSLIILQRLACHELKTSPFFSLPFVSWLTTMWVGSSFILWLIKSAVLQSNKVADPRCSKKKAIDNTLNVGCGSSKFLCATTWKYDKLQSKISRERDLHQSNKNTAKISHFKKENQMPKCTTHVWVLSGEKCTVLLFGAFFYIVYTGCFCKH